MLLLVDTTVTHDAIYPLSLSGVCSRVESLLSRSMSKLSPCENTKYIIMLWSHASDKTEKSDFGSHANMTINSKTSADEYRLTV